MSTLSPTDYRILYLTAEYVEEPCVVQTLQQVQTVLDSRMQDCSIENTIRRIALTLNDNAAEDLI